MKRLGVMFVLWLVSWIFVPLLLIIVMPLVVQGKLVNWLVKFYDEEFGE